MHKTLLSVIRSYEGILLMKIPPVRFEFVECIKAAIQLYAFSHNLSVTAKHLLVVSALSAILQPSALPLSYRGKIKS